MPSLHSGSSPSMPWFLGAPVSKAIATSVVVFFVVAEVTKSHNSLSLDMEKVLNDVEIHRMFLCHLTFASIGEVILGLGVLCPLMRRFEREMGSRKFGTFLFFTTTISTCWEILLSQVFHEQMARYSGPYPQLGALLTLYHIYTPRLHPQFFGLLGFDFSEKAITYGFAAQVLFSGGLGTFLPALCGMVAGYLYTTPIFPLSKWELPELVYNLCSSLGASFIDRNPAIMASRRHRAGGVGGGNRQQLIGGDMRYGGGGAPVPPRPPMNNAPPAQQFQPTPPSEETITQLTSMGFEREAVVRALQQTDNNVEAAANRLLSGA
mmetsp:Transcript_3830/g.5155  ORF Transcript_3830/g.5155 Transcript_3830/m.5155 type:complete len:321 (-) Transcript_3830:318-1280(-)|eukprot:CAMPEP_0185727592 /NCGR_PEP_ID=MMETSP1171-20130828/3235_1 /TAXON_ID=374046 /ORGANISM="Helicotheca tamensis, Strain CCMP826" /LENGTH=320 /DNA_ID=CAMNT_0028396187 /DNA_START=133 /DNA_END=1095 /DNA_ORIENTATION=-